MSSARLDYLKKVEKELNEAERLEDLDPQQYKRELNRLLSSVERYKNSVDRQDHEIDGSRNRAMHQTIMLKSAALVHNIQQTLRDLQERSEGGWISDDLLDKMWSLKAKHEGTFKVVAVLCVVIVCLILLA